VPAKFIINILFVCFLLHACKKDKKESYRKTIPVSEEIKQWGLFQQGSYWIVRDSLSLAIDSIYVEAVTYSHDTHEPGNDTIYIAETVSVEFSKPFFHPDFTLSSYPYDHISSTDYHSAHIFETDSTIANSKTEKNGIFGNHPINNYKVQGNNYADTRFIFALFSYDGPSGNGSYRKYDRSFWHRNIGLVKRIYFPGPSIRCCELLRYHIVQ